MKYIFGRKHSRILRIWILGAFFSLFFFKASAVPEQSFIVKEQKNNYTVYTDVTGEKAYASPDAAKAIQWAVDHVTESGINAGEVVIEAGIYPLKKPIRLKSNVWLKGKGNATRLMTRGSYKTTILIQNASFAVVSDLAVVNGQDEKKAINGIMIEQSVNCQVLNTTVSGFDNGINNNGKSSLTVINNNTLTKNSNNILINNGGGVIGRWIPLLVSENVIHGGGVGIQCNAMDVIIADNMIYQTLGRGIFANTNSILLYGNHLSRIGGDYAIFGSGAEFIVVANTIWNTEGNGIYTKTRWGNLTANTLINIGAKTGQKIGIHIVSDNVHSGPAESKTITGNVIYNDQNHHPLGYGIKEDGGFNNIITGNIIHFFKHAAVKSTGKGTIVNNNAVSDSREK